MKTLREMLEDRALPTDGRKAALVKRLEPHHKSKGETGNDLLFMKAPKIRKSRIQPVLLDLTQDGQPGEETRVTRHAGPANVGKVMQTTLLHGTVQASCDGRDVGIAGAQDQAIGLTAAEMQKAINEAVQKGVYEATKTIRERNIPAKPASAAHGTRAPGVQSSSILHETMPGGDQNLLRKLLELTAEAAKW